MNERACNDLIEAGQIAAEGALLHDGTAAGVGDVVTRHDVTAILTAVAPTIALDHHQV